MEFETSDVSDVLSQYEVDMPIVIDRQAVPHAVMIPCELFQAMHKDNRQVLLVDELTGKGLKTIRNTMTNAMIERVAIPPQHALQTEA